MKNYQFSIDKHQVDWIFAPIRTRIQSIEILMKTLKILLLNIAPHEDQIAGKIILQVSKMSRIFFVSENKFFSLTFPFYVTELNGIFSFKSHSHSDINHKVSSDILSLIDSQSLFESQSVFHFAEPIDDLCLMDGEIWSLFRELLMTEEGYIRFDHDPKHQKGHHHPLNHFDIFFSSNATFKLGLNSKINSEMMLDILDSSTPCHYVVPVK